MTPTSISPAVPHIKAGTLRPLCFFEKRRLKEFPDVPTASEFGYPVFYASRHGIMAPKGTPEEVVRTLITASKKVVKDHKSSILDQLGKLWYKLDFITGEEFGKELKAEYDQYKYY